MSDDEGAPLSVWIGLSVITVLAFWSQAAVTEERFVPALNVIATKFNIPDDIAGATLMAAGASSPELFSSIMALFVTHSALGLGTIVGSEIFNQLVICAGAIFAAKSGYLELDRAIIAREVFFYALSIGLLLYVLHDVEPTADDDMEHIFISFFDACILFSGYIAYVLVCANFEAIVKLFSCKTAEEEDYEAQSVQDAMFGHLDNIPFVKVGLADPAANFVDAHDMAEDGDEEHSNTIGGLPHEESEDSSMPDLGSSRYGSVTSSVSSSPQGDNVSNRKSLLERSMRHSLNQFPEGYSARFFRFLVEVDKPSEQHEVHDIEYNSFQETMSCFLWQRSLFYSKSKLATKGWNLRWFNFTAESVHSVPDRADSLKHRITYPHFEEIEVDEARLVVCIINPDPKRPNCYLMAPSREIFDAVVRKLDEISGATAEQNFEGGSMLEDDDPDSHGSLLDFPYGGSSMEIAFHIILFPLKALMHYTIPDVRVLDSHGNPTATLGKAFMTAFMCLIWLIVGSYAMVASLEALADMMNIPDAVIGVTVSAAGTSLPNYVASKIAAEKGFGNMAVSNAFGSNTFNIMVALGLPWVLYTSFGTHFEPYHGLRNDGILESVLIMSLVLAVFVINVLMSGFKLYRWHAFLYICLYVAYLTFAIGQVYW